MTISIDAISQRIGGKPITGVMFRRDSVELHCGDDQLLKLFALPNVIFHADNVADWLNNAPFAQRLVNLVGRTMGDLQKNGMNDYCIKIEDFAVLIMGEGKSLTGQTGLISGGAQDTIAF